MGPTTSDEGEPMTVHSLPDRNDDEPPLGHFEDDHSVAFPQGSLFAEQQAEADED